MSNIVVTTEPAVPTPHPGAKYAKTYESVGVRMFN